MATAAKKDNQVSGQSVKRDFKLQAKTLENALANLDKNTALVFDSTKPVHVSASPAFYVDRLDNPMQTVKTYLLHSSHYTKILFYGHKGCGKSTELNRLSEMPEINEKFFVVKYSILNVLDIIGIDYIDFLLSFASCLYIKASDAGISFSGGILKSLEKWINKFKSNMEDWKEEVKARSTAKGIYNFFIRVSIILPREPALRDEVRTAVKPDINGLATMINTLVTYINSQLGDKELLIIIDDLEKIPGIKKAEELFINAGTYMTVPECKIIYTLPIALLYSIRFQEMRRLFDFTFLLPYIKLRGRRGEGKLDPSGFVCEFIRKRIESSLISPNAMDLLIENFSGSVQELLRILRDSCLKAMSMGFDTIELDTVAAVLENMRDEYARVLSKRHMDVLRAIQQDEKVEVEDREALIDLFHSGALIVDYDNQHINPIILKTLKGEKFLPVKDPVIETREFKSIRIERLRIKHVKCFDDVTIEFDTIGNTALIIGTNGKGKSTILQLIALGLNGIDFVRYPFCWKEVTRKGYNQGFFEIDLLFDGEPVHLEFIVDSRDHISCVTGGEHLESIKDTSLMLAYGANRSIKLEDVTPDVIEPIATLFGENGYLKHIKVSSTNKHLSYRFPSLRLLINKVLKMANGSERVEMVDFDSDSFYFKTPFNPDEKIPIEALGEGFKSTFVWLFDAIIRIVEKGGSLENAGDITGIILLDEIDLHLHPSWQRTILHSVETLFPGIQFIATTHSPFVVQSTKMKSFVVLETAPDSDHVKVIDKNITPGYSYEAIVNEIFNIQSYFSREVELKINRFREMATAIRLDKEVDLEKFKELVENIANQGVELDNFMRLEMMNLERRIGKKLDLWKK
jgi:signal recognition particle GTPase